MKDLKNDVNFSSLCKRYFSVVKRFDPEILLIDENVFNKCRENKCGNYNKHYMCPPLNKKVDFNNFKLGIILQNSYRISIWREAKIDFHKKILDIEKEIFNNFSPISFSSFIGGSCELCNPCMAVLNRSCKFPKDARPSLESCGINVIDLLKSLNLPYEFSNEYVTWTGAILLS